MDCDAKQPVACPVNQSRPDFSGITVQIGPEQGVADYRAAMALADSVAEQKLGDYMLLSWYDRDRDFESPQHASECHQGSDVPGYVDYALYRNASLKVDVEQGRFVFFYLTVEM
jgi:hypothetical protein